MLKEVGASGQISLGKKYAGQLFDVQTAPDGTITLQPMKAVPLTAQVEPAVYAAPPAAPPGGRNTSGHTPERAAQSIHDWSSQHATDIDQYNAWAEQREPYSQRVRRWRAEQKK